MVGTTTQGFVLWLWGGRGCDCYVWAASCGAAVSSCLPPRQVVFPFPKKRLLAVHHNTAAVRTLPLVMCEYSRRLGVSPDHPGVMQGCDGYVGCACVCMQGGPVLECRLAYQIVHATYPEGLPPRPPLWMKYMGRW